MITFGEDINKLILEDNREAYELIATLCHNGYTVGIDEVKTDKKKYLYITIESYKEQQ